MSVYKVLDKEFATFEEVIKWAWNEHKIDAQCEPQDEEEKQIACEELTLMLGGNIVSEDPMGDGAEPKVWP